MKRSPTIPLLLSATSMLGCGGEGQAPNYDNNITIENLANISPRVTYLDSGDTVLIQSETNKEDVDMLLDTTKLIDFQYPNGFEDENSARVSISPQRIKTRESLSGESPKLNNDLACDTIQIDYSGDLRIVSLGALALSDDTDDSVLVSWPETIDNEPGDFAYICFEDDKEPKHGVILFLKEE